ncbi:MAG: stage V sporulation T C-terminal domain-containing protein [Bacilli bacterium]
MKPVGVVRRIDELGRIVIPKEIRKTLRIHYGESLEIFATEDSIVLKKYSKLNSLEKLAGGYCETLHYILNENIYISNRDVIISGKGKYQKELIGTNISEVVENIMNEKKIYVSDKNYEYEIVKNFKLNCYILVIPINADGEIIGSLISFKENEPISNILKTSCSIAAGLIIN